MSPVRWVAALLLLNLWDALATYYGLVWGVYEGEANPLMRPFVHDLWLLLAVKAALTAPLCIVAALFWQRRLVRWATGTVTIIYGLLAIYHLTLLSRLVV